jgi:hypothetical protein
MSRRRARRWGALGVGLGLGLGLGAASADDYAREHDFVGMRVTLGRAYITGIDSAFYERIELTPIAVWEDGQGRAQAPMIGGVGGLDLWVGNDGSFGFGLPLGLELGLRHPLLGGEDPPRVFVLAGLGADPILLDFVDQHTGLGLFAPYSNVGAGFDLSILRLMVDAHAQYRWQWGADDRFLFSLGGALGFNAPM